MAVGKVPSASRPHTTKRTTLGRSPPSCPRGCRPRNTLGSAFQTRATTPSMLNPAGATARKGVQQASPAKSVSTQAVTTEALITSAPALALEEQWAALKSGITSDTILIPPTSTALPSATHCLVVIMPQEAKAVHYLPFAKAIARQAAATSAPVRVWVAVAGCGVAPVNDMLTALSEPDGTCRPSEVPTKDALLPTILQAVVNACQSAAPGLSLRKTAGGQLSNVVLLNHGTAGHLYSSPAIEAAGGLIMLQSPWGQDGPRAVQSQAAWAAMNRPVMVVGGQKDGVVAFPSYLVGAAISCWAAGRHGHAYAAAHKPVILVPGLNHAHMCGQSDLYGLGDCPSSLQGFLAVEAVGKVVACFLACNYCQPGQPAELSPRVSQARKHLVEQCVATAAFLSGYSQAQAAGDLLGQWGRAGADISAWQRDCAPGHQGSGHGPCSVAIVVEQLTSTGLRMEGAPAVHCGAVRAAEQEVTDIQLSAVQWAVEHGLLPQEATAKVKVFVNVHSSLTSFTCSQPLVLQPADDQVHLQAHVYPHWAPQPTQGVAGHGTPRCHSPSHWIKILPAESLAASVRAALSLPPLTPMQRQAASPMTAQAINDSTFAQALESVHETVRGTYTTQGVQLTFGEDLSCSSEAGWVSQGRVSVLRDAGGHQSVEVCSPAHTVHGKSRGPHAGGPDEPQQSGEEEALCVKVLSKAQAVEWIQLASLRHLGPQTWFFGC